MSYWAKAVKQARTGRAFMRNGRLYKQAPSGLVLPFAIAGGDDETLTKTLQDIRGAFETNQTELKTLLSAQDAEIKRLGTTTAETAAGIAEATKRYEEITASMAEAEAAATKRWEEIDEELKTLKRYAPDFDNPENKSLGASFIESDSYKAYTSRNFNGASDRVSVKTLITGTSIGNVPGYFYDPVRIPGIFSAPDRMTRVRSLFGINRTTNGAIEYVRETGFTNAAAAVAEGEDKPESALAFEIIAQSMRTIAHWIPATRQIISDAPALEDYINNRLIIGLKLQEDFQLLYGDGQGANIEGLMNVDGVQEYLISEDVDSNGDPQTKLDAIRRAILRARVAEYPASGVVLHPNDWADIELLKGNDGHYIWVNVNDGGAQRVWRVNVVDTTGIEPGMGLTGAFELGAAIWDREDAEIRIADQHADNFIKNVWTILAEERLQLAVYRPEAFVKIDFEEGS